MKNPVKMKDGHELFWLESSGGKENGYIEVHEGKGSKHGPYIIVAQVDGCVGLSGRQTLRKLAEKILKTLK